MYGSSSFDFAPEKVTSKLPASQPNETSLGKRKKISDSTMERIDSSAKGSLNKEVEESIGKTKKLSRGIQHIGKGNVSDSMEKIAKPFNPVQKIGIEKEVFPPFHKLGSHNFSEDMSSLPQYTPCDIEETGNLDPNTPSFRVRGSFDGELTFKIVYDAKGAGGKSKLEVTIPQYLFTGHEVENEEQVLTTFQLSALAKAQKTMWQKFEYETLEELYDALVKLSLTTFREGPQEVLDHLKKSVANLKLHLEL